MQSVGEMLRAEREKKGLTLKDIENATNIRTLYLEAIEKENYSIIPGEVFLKGFIRNYANFLGLNGTEFVELYRQSQKPAVESELQITGSQTMQPTPESRADDTIVKKWIFIGAFIVIFGGGALWWFVSNPRPSNIAKEQPAPATPNMPATPQTQTTPPNLPVNPPQPALPQKPATVKPIVVVAKFSNRSWTQVTVDGKQVFEGIPRVGETITWEANKSMELRFGNAAAVELVHNGQPLGTLGRDGEVVVKNFAVR